MSMRNLGYRGPVRQHGLTLVELMVSLVLSLVLMLGAMQLFVGSKQTYRLSDSLARVQESGREDREMEKKTNVYKPVAAWNTDDVVAWIRGMYTICI